MADLIERLAYFVADDAYGPRRKAMREAADRIAELEELLSRNLNAELLDQQQADRERIADLEGLLAETRGLVASLYVERDAALEALTPFAREYMSWDLDVRTSDRGMRIWLDGDDYPAEFGFADLRRAAALAALTGGDDR